MQAGDETAITEITIRPDGRIYVFGMSQEVLHALAALCPEDATLQARMAQTLSLIPSEGVLAGSNRPLTPQESHAELTPKSRKNEL